MKKSVWLLILIVFGSNYAIAGIEPEVVSSLTGSGLVVGTPKPTLETYDAVFFNAGGSLSGTSPSIYSGLLNARNLIWLEINQAEINDCQTDTFSFSMRIMIERKDQNGDSIIREYDTLFVNYDKYNGKTYKDKHSVAYYGGYYCKVTVLWISDNSLVDYVQLNNSLLIERYKLLNIATLPSFNTATIDYTNTVINVGWNSMDGAEEYDLEWTYIDDFGDPDASFGSGATLDASDINWSFNNNATRVTIKSNNYAIPLLNEHGYLLIRVRGVGRNGSIFTYRLEGAWSSDVYGPKIDNPSGTSFTMGDDAFLFVFETAESGSLGGSGIVKVHEPLLNWQYTSSFAEEGKHKEVIGYSDGSMRNRQMVTKMNSDETAIAGETVYDFQGRQAGSFMPVPTFENRLKFYPNFNLSSWSGKNYGPEDFDSSINYCSTRFVAPMDESSGAGYYYSANNPLSGQLHYEYVPDAQGYAFTVTEYMPDGTGRVRRQSGVGPNHQLGSGHETKYFYGTPDQIELDRVFGTAVGYSQHYQKNMIIDPNGQVSVSYLDLQGRVVATALAGSTPDNLQTLPNTDNDTTLTVNVPVDFKSDIFDNKIETSKQIIVAVEDNHVIDYSIEIPRHTENSQPLKCFDCVYDLEIKLIDECGDNILDGDPNTMGVQTLTKILGRPIASTDWDVSCSTVLYSFTLDDELNNTPITINLPVGSYTLIKTLKINEEAYQYYEDEFLADNDSLMTLDDFTNQYLNSVDFGQCETNCDSCYAKLGSWTDFLSSELARLSSDGITANADDSAAILGTYQSLADHCSELCQPVEKSCDIMLDIMIADVSPGGQYAPITITDDGLEYGGILKNFDADEEIVALGFNYSHNWVISGNPDKAVFNDFRDSSGNLILVNIDGEDKTVSALTVEEFVSNFRPDWANTLVNYHPEYCKYQLCKENEASEDYERRMLYVSTFQEALDSGFLNPMDTLSPFTSISKDPYFLYSGNGYSDKSSFASHLSSYKLLSDIDPNCTTLSAWDLAKATYLCNYNTCLDINTCLSTNSWGSITCQPVLDNIWIMFRSIYLSERRKIIEENYPSSCPRNSSMIGYIERFPSIESIQSIVFSSETSRYGIQDESQTKFLAECDTNCMYNADIWIGKLRDCGWNTTDSTNFREQLIAVCRNACDADHPFGASSYPSGQVRVSVAKNSYTSFQAVFDDYVAQGKMTFAPGACDINTIGFPLDYDHNYTKFVDNNGEPCTKDGFDPPACTQSVPNSGLADMYKRQYRQQQPDSTKCDKCITCKELHTALSVVVTEYGGSIDEDDVEIRQAITNSLNRQLNFNLGWLDYYDFMMQCGEFSTSDSNVLELFLDLWVINAVNDNDIKDRLYLRPNIKFDYNKRPPVFYASVDEVYTVTGDDSTTLNSCMCNALVNPALESTLMSCLSSHGADYTNLKSFCQTFYQRFGKADLTSSTVWSQSNKDKLNNMALVKRIYVPASCFLDYSCDVEKPSNETNPFYSPTNPNPPVYGSGSTGGGGLAKPDSSMLTTCDSIKWFMHIMDSICIANLSCSPSFSAMIKAYLFDKNPFYLSVNTPLLEFVNHSYDSMFPSLKKDIRFNTDPFKKFLAMLHMYDDCIRESYYVYDPNCCKQPNKYALALMATLNKMTSDYDPTYGNLLTIEDQNLYPNVPQYYNSKLYNGLYKTTVKYTNDPYGMPDLTMKFYDSLLHNRKVILSYTDNLYNEAEWSYIVKVKDFRLITLDYLCDSTSRFEFTAVQMTSWGPQDVKISGYFPGLNLGDSCDTDPSLKLCDRNYWDSHIDPDTSDCSKRIQDWADYMGERAYNEYIRLQKKGFRERYLAKCLAGFSGESFSITKPDHEYHYTLYYYDQAGNLIQTVPPAGVQRLTDASTLANVITNRDADGSAVIPSHSLKTGYEFNTLNQLIEQSTPDGGQSKFWYDNLGRLVVSQNAKQNAMSPKGYSYTIFDALGRITEVGQLQNSTTMTVSIAFDKDNLASYINGVAKTEVTRSIYDIASGSFPSNTHFNQENLRSRVSSIQYYPTLSSGYGASGSYSHAVHYTYDIHGNVDVLLREIPALSDIDQNYKSTIYKYDLVSGNVNQVFYQYGEEDMFAHKYVYDADNRVIETYTSHDLWHWDRDAAYSYYLHGPMSRTLIGDLSVQGIDYAYTLHGWIKGVNSTTLRTSRDMGRDGEDGADNQFVAKDVFGYSLGFFEGDLVPIGVSRTSPLQDADLFTPLTTTSALNSASDDLWNGNIRHMVTAIKPYMSLSNMPMARAYRYDQLNRIKDAYTYDEVELDSNLWKYTGSANPDYEEHFSFDANGNILTLSRNGTNNGGNTRDMDDFTYHYISNTNQLEYVDDSKAAGNYSDDIDDQSSGNYSYDEIGNLISDAAEQIASIEWTVYGKIKSITRTGGSSKPNLDFEYSPDGHRVIKKVTQPNGNITISYYIRDAQGNVMSVYTRNIDTLENDTLIWSEAHIYGSSRLGMYKPNKKLYGNGSAIVNYISGNGSINTRGDKSYELSNHLGNVLVVITDKRTASCDEEENIVAYEADIIDATDYYAYGSPMPMRRGLTVCEAIATSDTTLAYTKNEDFSSGSTGGFTASTGTVSNPTGNQLHMTATWPAKPFDITSVYLVNGRSYTLNVDIVGFSVVSGFSHTVRIRVVLPSAPISTDFTTTGTKTITFTSNTTGYVNIEVRSIISPSNGVYTGNPYIDIDNFKVSWDSAFTSYDTICSNYSTGYKYGYQGSLAENEVYGLKNSYTTEYRQLDVRLGRWFSKDPVIFHEFSPYNTMNNNPIMNNDILGDRIIASRAEKRQLRQRSDWGSIRRTYKSGFFKNGRFFFKATQDLHVQKITNNPAVANNIQSATIQARSLNSNPSKPDADKGMDHLYYTNSSSTDVFTYDNTKLGKKIASNQSTHTKYYHDFKVGSAFRNSPGQTINQYLKGNLESYTITFTLVNAQFDDVGSGAQYKFYNNETIIKFRDPSGGVINRVPGDATNYTTAYTVNLKKTDKLDAEAVWDVINGFYDGCNGFIIQLTVTRTNKF